jgi:Family of unknown function (DUF6521)
MSIVPYFHGYESRIVTNPGHCLVLIHAAVAEWQLKRSDAPFPLRSVFAILPVACHARTVEALDGKRSLSALVAAQASAPDWHQQFRQRVQKYSPLTCRAIAFGCGMNQLSLTKNPAIGLTIADTSALVRYESPPTARGYQALNPKAALNVARYLGKLSDLLGPEELLRQLGWRTPR